jgi:hypothetical protein
MSAQGGVFEIQDEACGGYEGEYGVVGSGYLESAFGPDL